MRWTKYGNRKTMIDGITFDSKAEATRYCELTIMQRAGEISDLQLQVPFGLIPAQRRSDGKMERGVVYVADFTYYDKNHKFIVEDVKGLKNGTAYQLFAIKRKLMLSVYNIEVREV